MAGIETVKPSSWASRSSRSLAMKSIMPAARASSAETALASSMVASASAIAASATAGGQAAHGGFEDLLLLGLNGLAEIFALAAHRAGGADGGLRRHGGGVAGQGDHRTGTASHGAAGRHVRP